MVENPEQAVYIIEWHKPEHLKHFLSSPACAEFLQNLPGVKDSNLNLEVFLESGSAMAQLTLDDTDAETNVAASASPSSRFLVLQHATETPTREVKGRVTFTTFAVPQKFEGEKWYGMWYNEFRRVFCGFIPTGSEAMTHNTRNFSVQYSATWFRVFEEDKWVEEKFGKLENQMQDDDKTQDLGRTFFCHFFFWPDWFYATGEREEALAADPQARESWIERVGRVMPPATAWVQERWDIRDVPRFYPPEPECDSCEEMEEGYEYTIIATECS